MTPTIPTSAFSLILLQDPVKTVCAESLENANAQSPGSINVSYSGQSLGVTFLF